MKNERKSLFVIVTILAVAVLGLSIAYAALSSTLTARFGSVSQTPQTWAVGFQPGTAAGTSVGGVDCGNATVTANQASVGDIMLSKPNDKCTYQLTIKNTGSIAAQLKTITPTSPSGATCTSNGAQMVCGDITYKITTDSAGADLLTTGGTLAASTGTLTVYLVATYSGTEVHDVSATQSGASFAIYYEQA